MKKRISWFLALVVTASLSCAGVAWADEGPRQKFYDFPTLTIDGTIKAPTATYISPKERVKFGRLLSLKKSFLPKLEETGKDMLWK